MKLCFTSQLDRSESTVDHADDRSLEMVDCSYRNGSDRMVIVRCCGSGQFFMERVVFPFEILAFRCPPMSEVKIWSHGLYGPELLESFTSERLLADVPSPFPSMEPDAFFPSAALQTTPWLQAS